jgi:hypothetical protein
MAEDDIGARGFSSYYEAIERIREECGWSKQRAGPALLDAVNEGRIRRKNGPKLPQPQYDPGNWNPNLWPVLASPGYMDRYGNWSDPVAWDGKPRPLRESAM